MQRLAPAFLLLALSLQPARPAPVAHEVLPHFPEYPNYYGCAPSCAAMMLGYWNINGYPKLLPGRSEPLTDDIRALIASDRHLADYWVDWGSSEEDPWMTEGRPRPTTNDCLADLMLTSRFPITDGWTTLDHIPTAIEYFARRRDRAYDFDATLYHSLNFREDFAAEIDAGRPVLLFIVLGSKVDHTVVGYGYDDTDPTRLRYAAMDTFMSNPDGAVDWRPWSEVRGGVKLRALSPPYFPPGDINEDGVVNVADLLIVRNNLGGSGSDISPPGADIDDDDVVNVSDLLFVRNSLSADQH